MSSDDLIDRAMADYGAGRRAEAEAACREALAAEADQTDALYLLAVLLSEGGKWIEAESLIRRAMAGEPDAPEYHFLLGVICHALKKIPEAIGAYHRCLELDDSLADAHSRLGALLLPDPERSKEAIGHLRCAAELLPKDADAWVRLGCALHAGGFSPEAESAFVRALAVNPRSAVARYNLANVLSATGRADEAMEAYRAAAESAPDMPEPRLALAAMLQERGDIAEAITTYRQVIDTRPEAWDAWLGYLYTLWFSSDNDGAAVAAEHRRWAGLFTAALPPPAPHENDRSPARRIRLGYVSASFGRHVIGMWAEHLVARHDRRAFEVYCYSRGGTDDDVARNTAARADAWRDLRGMNDEAAATLIRADRVDLLIDLNVCLAGSALGIFARKPAPVQVTHVGYPGTTGLRQMDYRITDECLDPPGASEGQSVERLAYLPGGFYLIVDRPGMPDPGPPPALAVGHVTFGCLNHSSKLCPATIDLFSRVMHAVPSSRLILNLDHPGLWERQRRAQFAARGIDPARIDFVPRGVYGEYLATYRRIDIGLDPIPYCGGMTTCDALMMGVPVVSLAGTTSPSRAGRSILSRVALEAWVSDDAAAYVDFARGAAGDITALARLRAELPGRMKRSSILNPAGHTRELEEAYQQMWRDWCGTKRPL